MLKACVWRLPGSIGRIHRYVLRRALGVVRNAWLIRPCRARGNWPGETKCLRSMIHAGILKAWGTRRFNGMHQLTAEGGGHGEEISDFVRSLVSASVFLPTVWLLRTWFKAYLLMYCHANDSQEAWKAYNALITKIWPSNVNILSMSTRAVTSIAYLVYTDTQKNMIATKIQLSVIECQNILQWVKIRQTLALITNMLSWNYTRCL